MKGLLRFLAGAMLALAIAAVGVRLLQEIGRPDADTPETPAADWRPTLLLEEDACRRRYGDPAPRRCLRPDHAHGPVRTDAEGFLLAMDPPVVDPDFSVVCLGGATVQGEGRGRGDAPGALARALALALPSARIDVRNAGVEGSRSRDLEIRYRHDIQPLRPDLLVILPDPDSHRREDPAELEMRLSAIVERAHAEGTEVLLGFPPIQAECRRKPKPDAPDAPPPEVGAPSATEAAMHGALARVASAPGVTAVDHRSRFARHPFGCELFAAHGAPNLLGRQLIGVELARFVAEAYRRGNQRGTASR